MTHCIQSVLLNFYSNFYTIYMNLPSFYWPLEINQREIK